jgi:ABC-type multidrug transport system permease subunit
MCLFALMGSGIGLLIGATMLDVKKALTVSVIVVLSSILLGGFFIRQENLRPWIRWARWTSFIKYSYELTLLNEYDIGSRTFTPTPGSSAFSSNPITGQDILNNLNVETNIWGDVRIRLLL